MARLTTRNRMRGRLWLVPLFVTAACCPAGAQRFAEITASGPFAWLHGTVMKMAVGPLTGGDWVDVAPVDWDADGRVDLFTGSGYGDLLFFRQGADGIFTAPSGLGSSEADPFAFSPTPASACPKACDWDGDGDLDLLLGTADKVFLYETRTTDSGASFAAGVELLAEGATKLIPVADCGIAAASLTPGELPHLFISAPDGRVLLARRKSDAILAAPVELVPAGELLRVRADLADFNDDGVLDLIAGTGDGRAFIRFGHAADPPAFGDPSPIGSADGTVSAPQGVRLRDLAPRCVDFDLDGDADILFGCRSGHVLLLERTQDAELSTRDYLQQVDAPIDAGRCAAGDLGDWNGDGRIDLVVGREDGLLQVHLDEGRGREGVYGIGRIVAGRGEPWMAEGGFAQPAVVSFTGEALSGLAVGSGAGRAQLLTRSEAGVLAAQTLSAGGRALELPGLMTVCATDYDRDGDTDLFLGARSLPGGPLIDRQPIIYLENRAGRNRVPHFNKAAQIELYTTGPADDSPLEEAGPLRPSAASVIEWIADEHPEFIVSGAQGVDLFTTPARRNVYPTLFLAPSENSHLLPPVYFARSTRFNTDAGILVGTEAYGILTWYSRAAWSELEGGL